ncbi:MAG: hypothetical protein Q8807_01790 ['Waltheria sp.' little leaf phytoplasma]|nr:hypothetical protein ['Waltheria sp.' little leaf phytoplasma]
MASINNIINRDIIIELIINLFLLYISIYFINNTGQEIFQEFGH